MTIEAPTDLRMRAVSQSRLGDADVLELIEAPRPVPGPGEVLIRVASTGLNPTDWGHRRIAGFLGDGPRILGWDVAGTVEEVGFGVQVHRAGDHVFGMLPYPGGVGSAAEFVVAPARAVVPVPENLDLADAGAVPLAALTAWQALVDTARVGTGDRVLIHGAGGGVGHFAVQIAAHLGARVIGTAGPDNQELLRSLGVDEVIDYRSTDFSTVIEPVDMVLDGFGGDTTTRSLSVTRRGGIIVSLNPMVTQPLGEAAEDAGVRHAMMLVEADHEGMTRVADLVRIGALAPHITGRYDFGDIDQVREAHRRGEAGHVAGKLVLTMK